MMTPDTTAGRFVEEIMALVRDVPYKIGAKRIARILGIPHQKAISGIITGRRWTHVCE